MQINPSLAGVLLFFERSCSSNDHL